MNTERFKMLLARLEDSGLGLLEGNDLPDKLNQENYKHAIKELSGVNQHCNLKDTTQNKTQHYELSS